MTASRLNFDPDVFLAQHWQREPLLIRDAITPFSPPLGADELAGLALEQDVESRLITGHGNLWELTHGPFELADLQRTDAWTLLVQAVDHYVPEVARLRQLFHFIPEWRMDDVMVSYASDGGSVGPHFDNYDVFLLQGEGQRRWRIGQHCDGDTAFLPLQELRILEQFDTAQEYLLNPGDMLYIPPGIAHWGVAEGECTTFSIGFRAPRLNDMISRWVDEILPRIDAENFFTDPGRTSPGRAGEITGEDFSRAQSQLRAAIEQSAGSRWFGELATEPRYTHATNDEDYADTLAHLQSGEASASLLASAKLAWQASDDGILVFANGESLQVQKSLLPTIMTLCEHRTLDAHALNAALALDASDTLLKWLLQTGCIDVE